MNHSPRLFSVMGKITAFALPISAGGFINMINSFIAMMMVAFLGKDQLAAGALAVPTFFTILTVTATIFYAISILISHQSGQNKSLAEVGSIVKNGFYLAIFLAIPASFVLWHLDRLLLILGQEPHLVAYTRGYFHFAALSMLPSLMNAVIAQFFVGIGKPKFTFWVTLINLPLTILFGYLLILGHFGMPTLGLSGVSCVNLIVQLLMLIVLLCFIYFQEKNGNFTYHIFKHLFIVDRTILKSILTLGLPIGIQFGGELAAMACSTYLMGYFGATALASAQIVSQYTMLFVVLTIGLTQSLSVLISEAYAKKNHELIKIYLKASLYVLFVLCFFASILFLGAPKLLIHFYMGQKILDTNLISLTTIFFAINATFILIDGTRHLLAGGLRGLHDSTGPMRLGLIAMWFVSLPMSYLIGIFFQCGPVGLRIGFICGFVFAVLFLSLRLYHKLNCTDHSNSKPIMAELD